MATVISTYKTIDGKTFNDEAAANAHEAYLAKKGAVEAYIAKSGLTGAQAGLVRRVIVEAAEFLNSDEAAEAQAAFEAELQAAAEAPKPKRASKKKAAATSTEEVAA